MIMDRLKTGEGMESILMKIEFRAQIPDPIFAKASLRKVGGKVR